MKRFKAIYQDKPLIVLARTKQEAEQKMLKIIDRQEWKLGLINKVKGLL